MHFSRKSIFSITLQWVKYEIDRRTLIENLAIRPTWTGPCKADTWRRLGTVWAPIVHPGLHRGTGALPEAGACHGHPDTAPGSGPNHPDQGRTWPRPARWQVPASVTSTTPWHPHHHPGLGGGGGTQSMNVDNNCGLTSCTLLLGFHRFQN